MPACASSSDDGDNDGDGDVCDEATDKEREDTGIEGFCGKVDDVVVNEDATTALVGDRDATFSIPAVVEVEEEGAIRCLFEGVLIGL